jgi:hypothetical protein
MSRSVLFATLYLFLGYASVTHAKAPDSSFSGELSTGLGYEDSLQVADTDIILFKEDYATLVDLYLKYDMELQADTELKLSYNFSRNEHNEVTTFDTVYHYVIADLSHGFDSVLTGLVYQFFDYQFGGKPLLELQRTSVYAARFFGRKTYLRAEYMYSVNDYDNRTDRDTKTHTVGGNAYYFLDGNNAYLLMSYKYKDENAGDSQHDYAANKYRLQLVRKFKAGNRLTTLKIGWRLEDRDYTSVTNSIGVNRDERRHRYQLEWRIPISKKTFTLLQYERSNNVSNLPSADYTRNVVSIRFGYQF